MKRIVTSVRIPEPLYEALRLLAFDKRVSKTDMIINAVVDRLDTLATEDSRIASYMQEYHTSVSQVENADEGIPEEYR